MIKSKWEAAAKAAEEVMKLGYSLDTDYKGLFLNPMSSEIIFHVCIIRNSAIGMIGITVRTVGVDTLVLLCCRKW